jgi:hypothetical protein
MVEAHHSSRPHSMGVLVSISIPDSLRNINSIIINVLQN